MQPFFSIIIPLYNKENHIEDTLASILNQTFQDFEIIIINDGSTDNSIEKVISLNDERIQLFSFENQGVSYARNYGIEKASSDYIALLDADDIWYSSHLEELHKSIVKFTNADLLCNAYEIALSKNFIKRATYNISASKSIILINNFFSASLISSIAHTSAVAFSKKAFEDIGGFNVSIKSGQDTDLWIRFALKKCIAFNPIITSCYNNMVDHSLSKSNLNQDRYNSLLIYEVESRQNISLKKYLDINRYALAIRCKMNNEIELYKKVKKEIDYKNLNFKQKMLLRFPKVLLKFIKRFQYFLIDKKIYLTAYK